MCTLHLLIFQNNENSSAPCFKCLYVITDCNIFCNYASNYYFQRYEICRNSKFNSVLKFDNIKLNNPCLNV